MVRKTAIILGIFLTSIGLLGFIPGLTPTSTSGMPVLFGIFMVSSIHNAIHLLSGITGLVSAKFSRYAGTYLKFAGVFYGIVALVGFIQKTTVLGFIDVNTADNILHLVLALVASYIGFAIKPVAAKGR